MRELSRKSAGRVRQFIFTFREIAKLAFQIQPKFLVAVFAINILSGLLVTPTLLLQKIIIDTLIQGATSDTFPQVMQLLTLLIAGSVTLSFIQILINRASRFMQAILVRGFNSKLHLLVSRKLSELDLKTIESPSFKDRYTKIDEESGRAYQLIGPLADIPGSVVSLISAVAILVTLSPLVALGVVLSSFPRIFVNSRLIKKQYNLSTELAPLQKTQGWLNYYLLRNRSYMELKLLNLIPHLSGKYETNARKILDKRAQFDWDWEKATVASFIPLDIFDAGLTIWMAFLVLTKSLSVGSFQLYYQALRRVEGEFQGLASSLISIYENYMYVSDLVWLLKLEPTIKLDEGLAPPDVVETIEFKDVWFRYKKGQRYTLRGISLLIKQNEHLAIVGTNGSGKSTLLKLLARFYDPDKGDIYINGTNLKEYSASQWRARLAILFQEFETYPFSAHESIGYGDIESIENIEEIENAAKRTGINSYIEKLPMKYETPLSPEFKHGTRPSIGQWQRIGISRMLFRKHAEVIVMDEPTSSVDPEAEEQIFKELKRLATQKILIFVTQRFSTVRIADQILLMANGKVLEYGTHKALLQKKGKYKDLFDLQAKGYK